MLRSKHIFFSTLVYKYGTIIRLDEVEFENTRRHRHLHRPFGTRNRFILTSQMNTEERKAEGFGKGEV